MKWNLYQPIFNQVNLDLEEICIKNICENCDTSHEHLVEKENELIHLRELEFKKMKHEEWKW